MITSTMRLSILGFMTLLLASVFPILVDGQERTDTDGSSIEIESSTRLDANYNNTRSNRSSVAAPTDTNVCDGVTCSDGSCAATQEMCGAEEMAVDSVCNGFLCDSGECVSSEAMCGITDAVDMAADSVCNGFLCDNGDCVSSQAMCGISDAVDMAADSVCNGYLCDSGQCVSDEVWCGVDFDFAVDATATVADSVCNGYLCNDGTCVSSQVMCELNFDEIAGSVAICPAGSPIRCGDGSCASEVSICRAIEDRVVPEASARAQSHNSSRSNRTEGVANDDMDSDGDGLDDGTERAQDYNSSRSNKPSRAIFSDTDADGRPEVSLRGGTFVEINNETGEASATTGGGAGRVKCWSRAENEDGNIYAWGQGICIASEATASATGTAQARLAALQVRGDDIRSWSETERTAWQEFRQSEATTSPHAELVAHMVAESQTDERIQEITSDDEGVEVRYQTEMRLFGLIPLQREVTARAATDGNVTIEYPWYRFLSTTPDNARINSLLLDTMDILVLVSGRAG